MQDNFRTIQIDANLSYLSIILWELTTNLHDADVRYQNYPYPIGKYR